MGNSPSWGGHLYAAAGTLDHFTGANPSPAVGVPKGPGWGCDSNRVTLWTDPSNGITTKQPSCVPAPPGLLDPATYPNNGAFRPTSAQYVPTIFDRLDDNHLSWKLYTASDATDYIWAICPSFAECIDTSQRTHMMPPASLLTDASHGKLPDFSIVLPSGPGKLSTSQHNLDSMRAGDNWIGQLLAALQSSSEWSSTAVFVTYDDCGCFYDHVPPATNPDHTPQGIRVPMVIASPYTKPSYVDSTPATFASILRFTEETFGLTALGVNDAQAYDYANAFDFSGAARVSRARLYSRPVSPSSIAFIGSHPPDSDDPT
jgi:phospholipase C